MEAQIAGPAVLGNGGINSRRSGELVSIRPYASLNGTYSGGLTPSGTDANGDPIYDNSYGVSASAGVSGYHSWRRSVLNLSYNANSSYYGKTREFTGFNQSLSLMFAHEIDRSTEIYFQQSAGSYSSRNSFGGVPGFGFPGGMPYSMGAGGLDVENPNSTYLPGQDLVDSRTYYGASTAGFLRKLTPRISAGASASTFLAYRTNSGLVDGQGVGVNGGMSFAVGRNQSLTVGYGFNHFGYRKSFGASDLHGASLGYSRRVTRSWQLSVSAGAYRAESLRTISVQLDPVIASILGQTTGLEAYYGVTYGGTGSFNLNRSFRRSSLSLGYSLGVTPGNGLYLTSRSETAHASYGYSGIRNWNFGVSGNYSKYSALTQNLAPSHMYMGSVNVSRRIASFVFATANAGVARIEAARGPVRDSYFVAVGLAFSPGEYPLSIW